jgi:hypothetical protein
MAKVYSVVPAAHLESKIYTIRGHKVMLDTDLATIYGVETKILNRAVMRNIERFPERFMFQLTRKEWADLRCQFGTSRWGGRRYRPRVFTEHGAVMLASVLNSRVAVVASVQVVEAFIRMRKMLIAVEELAQKLDRLERKMVKHDRSFAVVFQAIRDLMQPSSQGTRERIGFKKPEK